MSNKKTLILAILITVATLFASGCGNASRPVSAEPDETAKEVDTEESAEPTPSPTVETEESIESPEVEDNSENEVDTTEEESEQDLEHEITSSDDSSGSISNSGGNTGYTGNSNTESNSSQTVPTEAATSEPVSTPTPVHEHVWKEHIVQSQTWVPNIVIVDDYETQTIESYLFICYCNNFETTDADVIRQHVEDNTRAQIAAGTELICDGFTIQNHSYTQQVKVGSHEEDQGHYETSTYVDYYYCECGAIK